MAETDTLPTAGQQQYEQLSVAMKFVFQQISLTDVALTASKKSKEFLVDVLESEYQGAKKDLIQQIQRMWWGIGTGELFKVNGDPAAGTTVNTDTPMVGKNPMDYIEEGGTLRFGATASTIGTVSTITDTDTFELTASVAAIADNDAVYHAVSATQSAKDNEMMGLKGIIDDGAFVSTLQTVDRTATGKFWWQAYVNDATASRSLTDTLLHTTFLEAKRKGDPKYALTSFDVYKSYGLLLTPDRRYTNADSPLKGGFVGLEFNDIPIVADYHAPFDEVYFIDPTAMTIEDLGDITFLNEDGSILDRSATTPAWNATIKYYANLAAKAPNKCSSLRDVTQQFMSPFGGIG